MRITVTLDETLLAKARKFSGINRRNELLCEALQALIQSKSAAQLACLGGTEPKLTVAPRRRWISK